MSHVTKQDDNETDDVCSSMVFGLKWIYFSIYLYYIYFSLLSGNSFPIFKAKKKATESSTKQQQQQQKEKMKIRYYICFVFLYFTSAIYNRSLLFYKVKISHVILYIDLSCLYVYLHGARRTLLARLTIHNIIRRRTWSNPEHSLFVFMTFLEAW